VAASYSQVRQYERAPIRERAVIVVGGVTHPGVVSRIGGGGVFFETNVPLDKGDTVLLRFRLACFEEPVTVKGEVRWVAKGNDDHPQGLGILFVDLPVKRRNEIVEFVAERGNVLCEVDSMLQSRETDLSRMKSLLAKVDLESVTSLEELRARVKHGMAGFFDRIT
jgi:Tfp pilus assembly protein PilZ